MKICVVIPTLNESKTIAEIVKKVLSQDLEVIVVDDGSEDITAAIARDNGATVLRNERNMGKGASLIRGFNFALDRGFEAVITMDGDGQHLAEEIPYFIRIAKYSEGGIFVGNRMLKIKTMPLLRILTNRFMSWLISFLTRQKIPDTQCGFRLIKKEVIQRINFVTSRYETESEILIKAARLGYRIESVPVKTVYNTKKSQINPFFDTLRFIKYIAKEIWTMRF